ncbi:MAG: hypothetical protein ACRD4F_08145 [Candidatus Angelobacter sp.]
METSNIIAELEAERDRLSGAIAALQGGPKRRGRRGAVRANGRKRHLSAAARKRIGDAMRKRWAARKKAAS